MAHEESYKDAIAGQGSFQWALLKKEYLSVKEKQLTVYHLKSDIILLKLGLHEWDRKE